MTGKKMMNLTEFMKTALLPVDQVLYVWGGGWNEEDTGGNEDSCRLGVAPSWTAFYRKEVKNYQADDHDYEFHHGLDCSGYVGWVLYNSLPEKRDYVTLAEQTGKFLETLGYGYVIPADRVIDILPGDIMNTERGHVYIALGQYEDGSVLLVHSSPPGVRISGTRGLACQKALSVQRNDWNPLAADDYLHYSQFRFFEDRLDDPDHLHSMDPDQVLDFLRQMMD